MDSEQRSELTCCLIECERVEMCSPSRTHVHHIEYACAMCFCHAFQAHLRNMKHKLPALRILRKSLSISLKRGSSYVGSASHTRFGWKKKKHEAGEQVELMPKNYYLFAWDESRRSQHGLYISFRHAACDPLICISSVCMGVLWIYVQMMCIDVAYWTRYWYYTLFQQMYTYILCGFQVTKPWISSD